jgi:hypothetical protein
MNAHCRLPAGVRTCFGAALVAACFLLQPSPVAAQTSAGDYPCPPYLLSTYYDAKLGWSFFGGASFTMRQADGTYTYEFNGTTLDGQWRLTGIAHIAPSDCARAYFAWLRGITIPIAQLHNVQLYHRRTACNDASNPYSAVAVDYDPYDGSSGDGWDEVDPDNPYASSCSNSGGTGTTVTCHDEYVYVEESNDGGVTWTILWEGWAQVCL